MHAIRYIKLVIISRTNLLFCKLFVEFIIKNYLAVKVLKKVSEVLASSFMGQIRKTFIKILMKLIIKEYFTARILFSLLFMVQLRLYSSGTFKTMKWVRYSVPGTFY